MWMLERRTLAFLSGEKAQTLGEYSLILTFIAVLVILTSAIAFRDGMISAYESALGQLGP